MFLLLLSKLYLELASRLGNWDLKDDAITAYAPSPSLQIAKSMYSDGIIIGERQREWEARLKDGHGLTPIPAGSIGVLQQNPLITTMRIVSSWS